MYNNYKMDYVNAKDQLIIFCLMQVTNRIKRVGDGSHYKLGTEEGRAAVTAWGPLHPLNPSYNSTLKAPDAILKPEGLPLYHENDVLNSRSNNLG